MPLSSRGKAFFSLAVLVFAIGIVQIELERDVVHAFREQFRLMGTTLIFDNDVDNQRDMWLVPQNLETSVTSIIEASGAITIIAGVVSFFLFANRAACDSETLQPEQPPLTARQLSLKSLRLSIALAATTATAALVTLAIMIYVLVREALNPQWHYTNYGSTPGTYTQESWACQMHRDLPAYSMDHKGDDQFGTSCRQAQAAKYFLLPVFACFVIMFTMSMLQALHDKHEFSVTETKELADDKGGLS